jgi:hypothetical protein
MAQRGGVPGLTRVFFRVPRSILALLYLEEEMSPMGEPSREVEGIRRLIMPETILVWYQSVVAAYEGEFGPFPKL